MSVYVQKWAESMVEGDHIPRFTKLLSFRPRKYYYLTNLRDPIQRFLSEWRHVQRNATWKSGFGNLIFLEV